MRFSGERVLAAPVGHVWEALHDPVVLERAIPGCRVLVPTGATAYAATLAARVGPISDTYRGAFVIQDELPGLRLRVGVEGRGRCGALEIDLHVGLVEGSLPGTTGLSYLAHAQVRGLVARLGQATLSVAGGHLTGCFFRDLERALRSPRRTPVLV